MNYKEYQNARDAAWKLLIDADVRELPVKVTALCRQMGIPVKLFRPEDGNDGKCFLLDGRPVILVSDQVPPARQRFTAAHELGHILLGHVGKYQMINREPSTDDNPIEQAANVFASRLLAPACVLWALEAKTPEDIAELCQISRQAASFRAARMETLYERGRFLSSPLEREVYKQFAPFINREREKRL